MAPRSVRIRSQGKAEPGAFEEAENGLHRRAPLERNRDELTGGRTFVHDHRSRLPREAIEDIGEGGRAHPEVHAAPGRTDVNFGRRGAHREEEEGQGQALASHGKTSLPQFTGVKPEPPKPREKVVPVDDCRTYHRPDGEL
jgi:hypothetical protein